MKNLYRKWRIIYSEIMNEIVRTGIRIVHLCVSFKLFEDISSLYVHGLNRFLLLFYIRQEREVDILVMKETDRRTKKNMTRPFDDEHSMLSCCGLARCEDD